MTPAGGWPACSPDARRARRDWLGAVVAAASVARPILGVAWLAATAARAETPPATVQRERRDAAGFDAIEISVPGWLTLAQGDREGIELEAEPLVLQRITTEVTPAVGTATPGTAPGRHGRRLRIGLLPGGLVTREPIHVRVALRQLTALVAQGAQSIEMPSLTGASLRLELAGSGTLHVGRLEVGELELLASGARRVEIDHGSVRRQRIVLGGAGHYHAEGLASLQAELSIEGSGSVRLAAAERLNVRIAGTGQVRFRGDPVLTRDVRGVASIEKL